MAPENLPVISRSGGNLILVIPHARTSNFLNILKINELFI